MSEDTSLHADVQALRAEMSALRADQGLLRARVSTSEEAVGRLTARTNSVLGAVQGAYSMGVEAGREFAAAGPVKTGARHRAAKNPHNFLVLRGGALGGAIIGAVVGGAGGAAGAAVWLAGKTAPAMAAAVRHPAAQMATAMLAVGTIVTVPSQFANPHAPQPAILRQPSLSRNVVGSTQARRHHKGHHAARAHAPSQAAVTGNPSPSASPSLLPKLPAVPLPSPSLPLPSPSDTGPPYGPPPSPGVPPVG